MHRDLVARAPTLYREEAEVFTVALPGRPGEPLLLGALRDPEGTVARKLAESLGRVPGTTVLAAADRFGEFYRVMDVHGRLTAKVFGEVLEWLDLGACRRTGQEYGGA